MALADLFKNKKKKEEEIISVIPEEIYATGVLELQDVIAPSALEINSNHIRIGEKVARTLKTERFLDSVEEKDGNIIVKLSIFSKKPILSNVTIISRPGLRIYMSADEIEKIKTPDIYILTTPKGVLSGKMAKKLRVGGEVIAKVI